MQPADTIIPTTVNEKISVFDLSRLLPGHWLNDSVNFIYFNLFDIQ